MDFKNWIETAAIKVQPYEDDDDDHSIAITLLSRNINDYSNMVTSD